MISNDGAFQYIPVAKLFYQGDYFQALLQPQLPLYPFLIAIFSHITGDFELAGQLISIFFSLLAVLPLYLIGKFLFGPRAGFWTTVLYLIHPLMLRSSVDVLKEGLVIFFFFSSVYCSLWFLQNGKRVWLFWTVAFAIVGALFRMIILEILVVLGLWLGYGALRGRLQERRLACRYLGVVAPILGGILVFLIAVIWDWEFLTTKKVYGLIRNFFIQWFGYQKPNLFWVGAQCFHIIVRFIEKAYPLPFLLALFGLGGRVRAKEFGAEEKYLAILIAVLIIVFFLLLDASGRWLLLTIFLSYLWAGLGFITLRELIDRRFTRYPRLNAVVIVIILLGTILPISLQPQRLDKIGRKEVGLWLQERSLSSPVILTNIPRVVYYARGEYVSIPPQATPEEIVRKGAKESIDYLVIEEKGSGLSESFIPFEKKGELELVLRHPYGRKGRTIYVYKMKKQIGPS
jgi:4-amino-4-deoxy-L-arabinose transferase-like glycosyltransferase